MQCSVYVIILLCPGAHTDMEPPYAHISFASLQKHGLFPASIFASAGIHVPAGTIVQGCGVNTPRAAAVADATWGFARELHIPKPAIFTGNPVSVIVAIGFPSAKTVIWDVTFNVPGAVPKGQISDAPDATITPSNRLLSVSF